MKKISFISLKSFSDRPLIHKFGQKEKPFFRKIFLAGIGIMILGIISGYFLSSMFSKNLLFLRSEEKKNVSGETKKIVGSLDTKTFRDSAEGILEVGSINGEGTHKLIRPGGESQTVYLTSSVLDLNQFVGKKVRVFGETFAAKKAGWLMDVGKVEIL